RARREGGPQRRVAQPQRPRRDRDRRRRRAARDRSGPRDVHRADVLGRALRALVRLERLAQRPAAARPRAGAGRPGPRRGPRDGVRLGARPRPRLPARGGRVVAAHGRAGGRRGADPRRVAPVGRHGTRGARLRRRAARDERGLRRPRARGLARAPPLPRRGGGERRDARRRGSDHGPFLGPRHQPHRARGGPRRGVARGARRGGGGMTDDSRPFGLSRREHIMDELRRTGSVRVSDLARELGVAELTIRRDIGRLADEGLVTRVHGGATLRSALDTTVPTRAAASAPRFRVGMVVPSLNYYWPQIIVGARAAATEQRVQLALRGASYAIDDQRRQIASLVDSGGVHGLIVAPENAGAEGHAMLEWLDALPIPVVLVERRSPAALG